jgi:hypothetical protein
MPTRKYFLISDAGIINLIHIASKISGLPPAVFLEEFITQVVPIGTRAVEIEQQLEPLRTEDEFPLDGDSK